MKLYLKHVVSAVMLLLFCNGVYAEDKNSEVSKDKIYVIYLKQAVEDGSSAISNASVEKFLGVDYIVGTSELVKNTTIRIPTSNIAIIMEYKDKKAWEDSIEDYERKWGAGAEKDQGAATPGP